MTTPAAVPEVNPFHPLGPCSNRLREVFGNNPRSEVRRALAPIFEKRTPVRRKLDAVETFVRRFEAAPWLDRQERTMIEAADLAGTRCRYMGAA